MTMITPSYLGETIEYSSLHACRSTLEDPTHAIWTRTCPSSLPAPSTTTSSSRAGALVNRVTVRSFEGLRSGDIDWVWIVEEQRRATPPEIRKLCKAGKKR